MKHIYNFQQNENEQKNRRSKWIRRICLIAAILVIILLLLRFCGKRDGPEVIDNRPNMVDLRTGEIDDAALEGMSDEEIVELLNRKVQSSMITMSMNPDPTFRDGKGNLLIYNDASNQGPIVVEIKRSDTGELIYTSPVVPLGKRINSGALDVELPPGSYPCTAYFHYVDSTGMILGSGGIAVQIHVEN